MNERCTCGAILVEDALFCHKCGRPLREIVAVEPVEAPAPVIDLTAAPPPPIPAPLEISFRNSAAVRVGFLVAGLVIFLSNFTAILGGFVLQFFAFIALSAFSGVLAVWLYSRRTGQKLSIRSGARLGWITGVFSFVIVTVMLTVSIGLAGIGNLTQAYREQSKSLGLPAAEVDRALAVFNNPATTVTFLLVILATFFVTYTIAASLGGAVGAKLLDRGDAA